MPNREIKFRAWDKNEKQFVYFELFSGVNNHTPPIYETAQLEDWQQFTGLTDKLGKEIYEGDIVKTHFGEIVKIEIEEFSGGGYESSVEGYGVAFCDDSPEEVIGNIYESPNLLN